MDDNIKTPEVTTDNTATENTETTATKTAEEQIAELMAEVKRLKRASDKNASEASEWKKKFVATQSESEKLSMEKAERDAEIRDELEMLRKESKVNKYSKSFMAMGYSEDMANKAAEAQFNNDFDELMRIQKQHTDNMSKQIRADILKTMPTPATGNDDSIQMTQEQFDNLTYREQLEMFEKHPTVYEKFTKR